MITVTMRQMLEAGVHFGHQTRYWNPKMGPYIYGTRHRIHIINLEKTLPLYLDALQFVSNVISRRGKVLFVGTKSAARETIREEAKRCNMPYVDHRWLGGMLTNYKTIRQSIKRLRELEEASNDGTLAKLTKKEALNLMREKEKLERDLGGIKEMGGLPDAIFVVDVGHEKIAVAEAKRLSIPVIGIVDTNNSPDDIDYIVPGNDDSLRAIGLYAKGIADTVLSIKSAMSEADLSREKVEAVEEEAKKSPRKVVTKQAEKKAPIVKKTEEASVEEKAKEGVEQEAAAAQPKKAKKPAVAKKSEKTTAAKKPSTKTSKKETSE